MNRNNRNNITKKKGKSKNGKKGRAIKQQNKILANIDKDIKKLTIRPLSEMTSHGKATGKFLDCLLDPLNHLARTPQSACKTLVTKVFRTLTVQANSSGNLAFMFWPQNIATSTSNLYPFWVQNAAAYTDTNIAEGTTGWVSRDIGFTAPAGYFSGGRIISARIKATPNLSITTASGKGIIAALKVAASSGNWTPGPGVQMASNFAQLQRTGVIQDAPYLAYAEVAKMESLVADWLPHESIDLLEFPKVGFISGSELVENHPNEHVIVGIFSGLPANAPISFQFVLNQELVTESNSGGGHLYNLLGEFSSERSSPILALRDAYFKKGNLVYKESL